jgi:hypothetical protein
MNRNLLAVLSYYERPEYRETKKMRPPVTLSTLEGIKQKILGTCIVHAGKELKSLFIFVQR